MTLHILPDITFGLLPPLPLARQEAHDFLMKSFTAGAAHTASRLLSAANDPNAGVEMFVASQGKLENLGNGSKVVGTLACYAPENYNGIPPFSFAGVAVDEKFRRRGTGSLLLSMGIQAVRRSMLIMGISEAFITLETSKDEMPFYQNSGFWSILKSSDKRSVIMLRPVRGEAPPPKVEYII